MPEVPWQVAEGGMEIEGSGHAEMDLWRPEDQPEDSVSRGGPMGTPSPKAVRDALNSVKQHVEKLGGSSPLQPCDHRDLNCPRAAAVAFRNPPLPWH